MGCRCSIRAARRHRHRRDPGLPRARRGGLLRAGCGRRELHRHARGRDRPCSSSTRSQELQKARAFTERALSGSGVCRKRPSCAQLPKSLLCSGSAPALEILQGFGRGHSGRAEHPQIGGGVDGQGGEEPPLRLVDLPPEHEPSVLVDAMVPAPVPFSTSSAAKAAFPPGSEPARTTRTFFCASRLRVFSTKKDGRPFFGRNTARGSLPLVFASVHQPPLRDMKMRMVVPPSAPGQAKARSFLSITTPPSPVPICRACRKSASCGAFAPGEMRLRCRTHP